MLQIIKKIYIKLPLNFDILVGLFLLADFGQEKYAGIGTAPLEFLTREPESAKIAELPKQGGLFLGFNQNADLISRLTEILGLADNQVVAQLKELASANSEKSKFITSLIERYFVYPDRTILIALPLLKLYLADPRIWDGEMSRLEQENQLTRVSCFQGKKLIQIVLAESQVPEFDLWLTAGEQSVDLAVVKLASNIKISARLEKKIEFDNLVALLRIEEARKKRVPFDTLPKKNLSASGVVEPVAEWHYDKQAQQILSGDFGFIKTPLTQLPFQEFSQLIQIGLNPVLAQEKYPKFF